MDPRPRSPDAMSAELRIRLYEKIRAQHEQDPDAPPLVPLDEKKWEFWPPAENIHISSSAGEDEVNGWLDGLALDGAGEGWPYGKHPSASDPPKGFRVHTVYWD